MGCGMKHTAVCFWLTLAVMAGALGAPAGAEPRIVWRVENPFRFLIDPADTEVHRATYLSLSEEERRSPVLSAERALAARHPDGWAATMLGKTCWDSQRNRYACSVTNYINPARHTVVAQIEDVEEAAEITCTWLTAPNRPSSTRGQAIAQPCSEPVRLEIPYPRGARITVEIGGQEVAATDASVTDLFIVGMGDSVGSGEGNPDIPVRFSRERAAHYSTSAKEFQLGGYPARVGRWKQIGDKRFIQENARWLDQACHRSLYSHQLRAALELAIEDPHRAVTFVGVACSGAEVTDGLFVRYKGHEWVPNPPELSQISAVAEAQCGRREAPFHDLPEAYHMRGWVPELKGLALRKCEEEFARKIDLIFLSIGGNDVGFSRLVANAVLADESLLRRLGGWFGQLHGPDAARAQLDALRARYKSLNGALRNILHIPWEQSDRIVLTAYPGLALLDDGMSICPGGKAGMDIVSDFQLSEKKAREGSALAERLNDIMRASSVENGWTFIDAHRKAFLGRGICAGWSDLALSTADDLRLPRKLRGIWEPYNPADYRAYASRQRWFRTPNDAFMTGNFHASSSLMQSVLQMQGLSWFQLLLASLYSGAFHPTAEGHAAMADAVVERARAVLARYAQDRTAQAD